MKISWITCGISSCTRRSGMKIPPFFISHRKFHSNRGLWYRQLIQVIVGERSLRLQTCHLCGIDHRFFAKHLKSGFYSQKLLFSPNRKHTIFKSHASLLNILHIIKQLVWPKLPSPSPTWNLSIPPWKLLPRPSITLYKSVYTLLKDSYQTWEFFVVLGLLVCGVGMVCGWFWVGFLVGWGFFSRQSCSYFTVYLLEKLWPN